MSEDVTIGPLRCIVCGKPCFDPAEWVRANPTAAIYGLHDSCISPGFLEWDDDGKPIVKPSIEQRVKALERQFDAHLHVKSLYRS